MGYRGRLIWPFQCRIQRLDTAATEANPLAGQPSGYNRIWREPVRTNAGADSRVYKSEVALPCQVRTEMGPYDKQLQLPGGRELEFKIKLTLHYNDLTMCGGLVDATGAVVFQPSDKLRAIYKKDGTTLVRDFTSNPLFLVHVQDRSWGLSGLERNLVMLYFNDRRKGSR